MNPIALGIGGIVLIGIGFGTWKNPRLWGVLIWSFVATFMLTAALVVAFPAEFASKVFALTIIMPLVWAGFQFWLYWNPGRWTVTLILLATSVISAGVIALSPPPV